jgi:ATP-dependent exoDNAse (exonuclease V) beta subunit
MAVSELVREQTGDRPARGDFDPVDAEVGKLVHRLFEYDVPVDDSLPEVTEALYPEPSPAERKKAARSAAELYRRLSQMSELQELLGKGEVFREVPFSLRRENQILRGAIDSLVLLEGRVVLIDYKTGGRREEHRLQMDIYLEAARALFPERDAEGLVFYASGSPLRVSPPGSGAEPGSQLELF